MNKIKKIKVIDGISWVEIPDADVYIQCGCPADSVKHLMKQRLISSIEKDGVNFETGPNVILLSDVMLQGGEFSNLAEFPVLQMLYKQGMILPNHPNNTGIKPMIMGIKEQVDSQLKYIYRGNYGLSSEEEIIETGIDPEYAKELMNMKLKFAFGKLQKSEDFLDTLIIESDPVEIRNGVTIRRLSLNVFEINYRNDSVTVDLNLAGFDGYEAVYPLGFNLISRDYFSVIHLGEGDGWDINRPSMSSILMFHGKIYLIDAEPNIINCLLALGIGINEIDGIFHTHCHDDHFAGLTALIRADRKIKYFSTPLVRSSVSKKLAALLSIEESSFDKYFDVHDIEFDTWNQIEGLEVKPILSPHPVETNILIFRTLWKGGFRSYAHFADIVSLKVLENMIRIDDSKPGVSEAFYERIKKNYLTEANLKKLDIGGGLIHGEAEDFRTDTTEKIILAHTSLSLNEQQKEIGSGAAFGTVDTLIPSYKDYFWQFAYKCFKSYFPTAPEHQVQILLNNEIVQFNPKTIILKEGELKDEIPLILTGNIEAIQPGKSRHLLYPGTLVGELSTMFKSPSSQTYRTIGFVQALNLPIDLYTEFIILNNLYNEIERFQTVREFLSSTWLFGEGISFPVNKKIYKATQVRFFKAGEFLNKLNPKSIYIAEEGLLVRFKEKTVIETLRPGDFFGEETALFNSSQLFHIQTLEPTILYEIPGDLLGDIPIIRWKLFESFEKRKRLNLKLEASDSNFFYWKDWYKIGIPQIDDQHKKLVELAVELCKAVNDKKAKIEISDKLNSLVDYTKFHFNIEEQLMGGNKYPEFEQHVARHKELISSIQNLETKLDNADEELNLADFFTKWLIDHIFKDDKNFSVHLKKEEIYF